MWLWIARIIAVVALLCVAAAIATPPGRLPLALRGLQRILHRDQGRTEGASPQPQASAGRRFLAFVLVLLAALLAMV